VFVAAYQSDGWALIGDTSRRAIIERLSQSPCSVAELADDMPISRPAVSQHLKLLREAGIVRDEPHGRQRIYSLDAARLQRYRRQLDGSPKNARDWSWVRFTSPSRIASPLRLFRKARRSLR